jgi:MFS family permease
MPARLRALWAAGLGWGLDSFDFYLYVYALPGIIAAFSLSNAAAGFLATQTLVASAIGGIVMGVLADRLGRKRVLMLSVAWYALFTALCGVTHNYLQLSIFRVLEGFGFGGEWAVGAVLASEWAVPGRRGRSLGFVQGAWAIGWLLANAAFQIVGATIGIAHGWRVLFFLGILPALALLFIRRAVEDPPSFARRVERAAPPAGIFAPPLLRTTLLATVLAIGAQSGYYALFTWMPSFLTLERHLAPIAGGTTLYALIAGSYAGYLTAGAINDAIGRRATFILFSVCSAGMVPLYLSFVTKTWELVPAGVFLGYFASGIFTGFGPYLAELFPGELRATAQGFCYNVGRGFAGLSPFLVGALSARFPIGDAMIAIATLAYGIAIFAVLFMPETKGIALYGRLEARADA